MHRQAKVWVVDDDSSIRWVLERALNQAGIDNESFADADQLLSRIAQRTAGCHHQRYPYAGYRRAGVAVTD